MENRDTFLERLHGIPGSIIFSEEEATRIELAYDLAKAAHRFQQRKDGTRYFEHVRKVMLLLIDAIGLYDVAAIVAAILHDGWEDCPRYVTPLKVKIIGGEDAARILRFVSKMPKEGFVERLKTYADWRALAVKLCDRFDNFSDLDATDEAFQRKQTLETRDVYLPLFERLSVIAPPSHKPAVDQMIGQLDALVRQRATALGLEG
jgi:guanosine-3',5'-bis(diphosphate) 3'-pyrophosphohydrolase